VQYPPPPSPSSLPGCMMRRQNSAYGVRHAAGAMVTVGRLVLSAALTCSAMLDGTLMMLGSWLSLTAVAAATVLYV
jgi:hypothetical protein